jgi:hypothetical protein
MSKNLNVFFFETSNPNLTTGKKLNFSQKIGKSFAQRGMDVIPKGMAFIPKRLKMKKFKGIPAFMSSKRRYTFWGWQMMIDKNLRETRGNSWGPVCLAPFFPLAFF